MTAPSGRWCSQRLSSAPLREAGRSWVVLDLETTGLDPSRDAVTELAAIVLDADLRRVDEHSWQLSDGPEALSPIAVALGEHLRNGVIVAHNAAFDLGFLRRQPDPQTAFLGATQRWLCTLALVGGHVSLGQLAETQGVALHSAHTATGDATALALVLASLIEAAQVRKFTTVAGLAVVAPTGPLGRPVEKPGMTEQCSLDAVRGQLDIVVPIPPISALQRERFAEASRLRSTKVAADRLRGAGLSAAALDLLREEMRILQRSSCSDRTHVL